MKRFLNLLRVETRVTLSNRRALVLGLLLPVALLLFWGEAGPHETARATFGGPAAVPYPGFLLVGMMGFAAITIGVFNYAPALAALREQGILRRVRCTPLPTWQFLASRIAVQVAAIVASGAILTAIALSLFDFGLTWRTVPLGVGILLLVAALFLAIGQLVASLSRNRETANVAARLVGFALIFGGDLVLPLASLPHALARVLPWTPGSVAADLLRSTFLQGGLGPRGALNLAVLVGYLVVAFALSVWLFRWDEAA